MPRPPGSLPQEIKHHKKRALNSDMIEVKNERERRAYVTPTPLKDDISLARCILSGIRTRVVVQLGHHCMHAV